MTTMTGDERPSRSRQLTDERTGPRPVQPVQPVQRDDVQRAELRFCVASLEVLVRADDPGGLDGLGGFYRDYPSSRRQPDVIVEIERVPGFRSGHQRTADYPGFHKRVLAPGRIALERFDAVGEVEVPPEPSSGPVVGRFTVAENPNSLEAAVRIGVSSALPRLGGVVLHASAVARDDRCLLFAGVSGAGKSTIASLLTTPQPGSDAGETGDSAPPFTAISDELVILRPARPGPASPGRDGPDSLAPADSGKTDDDDRVWCAHVTPFVGSQDLPHGARVPLAGVHFLAQAPYHRRRPVARKDAVRELLKHVLAYIGDPATASGLLDIAVDLCARVPCYELEFSKDLGVLEVLDVT